MIGCGSKTIGEETTNVNPSFYLRNFYSDLWKKSLVNNEIADELKIINDFKKSIKFSNEFQPIRYFARFESKDSLDFSSSIEVLFNEKPADKVKIYFQFLSVDTLNFKTYLLSSVRIENKIEDKRFSEGPDSKYNFNFDFEIDTTKKIILSKFYLKRNLGYNFRKEGGGAGYELLFDSLRIENNSIQYHLKKVSYKDNDERFKLIINDIK